MRWNPLPREPYVFQRMVRMTRSRGILRIVVGIVQIALGTATLALYAIAGVSPEVLALATATIAAVALSLVAFRSER